MLKNYIKIALRNLRKNKIDSFISISGLALGLCACIILIKYVQFEWSYDTFHENRDSIFRLTESYTNPGRDVANISTTHPYPLAIALEKEFPEIEKVIKVSGAFADFLIEDKYISELITTVDADFLTQFSFPLVYGDAESALSKIDNIVLTESMARKYFGKTEVLGETMTIRLLDQPQNFVVSGVARDMPLNSSLQFQFLLPFENIFRTYPEENRKALQESLSVGFLEIWITLKEESSRQQLEMKFDDFLARHYDDGWISAQKMELGLQPLPEVYFDESIDSDFTQSTRKTYSMILGGLALIILIIAGINFMSLTLSRATSRFHEVGIRKTVGAYKHQIRVQIIGEVFITCSIAIIIGLIMAEVLSPYTGLLFGKEFSLTLVKEPLLLLSALGLLIILTMITSLYPAFWISQKNAISLFSRNTTTKKIPTVVKGLIVVQFAMAIALITGTYVMQNQIHFLLNKELGFNPENILAIEINSELENGMDLGQLYADEAIKINGVQSASITSGEYRDYSQFGVVNIGMVQTMTGTTLKQLGDGIAHEAVDSEYLNTMEIKLLSGSNFSKVANSYPSDEIIINQAFADAMNWEKPVGQIIEDKLENRNWTPLFDGKKVIGVIENYHFKSLYDPLLPMALKHIETVQQNPGTILVRIASANMSETISQLENLWDGVAGKEAFNISFIDDMVQKQYREEVRWNRIINIASLISVLLACFGLFGLSALVSQRRVKEIGIRKAFGASVQNILELVSKDFIILVMGGFIIAIPVAWYFSIQWLTNFSYKIDLNIWPFFHAGLTTLVVALITVSWQSLKAATANPVDSLKGE